MHIPILKAQYRNINNMLYISYLPKVINTAIEISLFEILTEASLTLDKIIEKLSTQKEVTDALLKVLTTIGLIVCEKDKYGLTDLSEEYLVQKSGANQLHDVKRFNGSSGPFDNLKATLKGEKPTFDNSMWSSKEAVMAMEQGTKAGVMQNVVSFIKTVPEFSSCNKMCDFAGSIGYYSYALLQENPDLRSHVYDLPPVCQIAKEVKQEEKDFDRVAYHDFDISKDDSFGDGYDLFFSSHFLYEFGANGALVDFFKKVNQSLKPGGIFVSNHICNKVLSKEDAITLSLVELQTRALGYPTHQLPESTLKEALAEAGFGDFITKQPNGSYAFPTLLLSAKKLR